MLRQFLEETKFVHHLSEFGRRITTPHIVARIVATNQLLLKNVRYESVVVIYNRGPPRFRYLA